MKKTKEQIIDSIMGFHNSRKRENLEVKKKSELEELYKSILETRKKKWHTKNRHVIEYEKVKCEIANQKLKEEMKNALHKTRDEVLEKV